MEEQFFNEQQPITENGHKLASDKSVDVFNALSLFHQDLGTQYEQDGYNPFDDGFVLTDDYANEILNNKTKDTNSIIPENFLEFGNNEIAKHFDNALQNDNKILDQLNDELFNCQDEKLKKQIKRFIVFVKNRNELLKVNKEKLKQKDANALKMYLEMYGMDAELSELLKDTFNEQTNNQIVVAQMLNVASRRITNIKQKAQTIKQVAQKEQANILEAQTQQEAKQEEIKQEQVKQEQTTQKENNQKFQNFEQDMSR